MRQHSGGILIPPVLTYSQNNCRDGTEPAPLAEYPRTFLLLIRSVHATQILRHHPMSEIFCVPHIGTNPSGSIASILPPSDGCDAKHRSFWRSQKKCAGTRRRQSRRSIPALSSGSYSSFCTASPIKSSAAQIHYNRPRFALSSSINAARPGHRQMAGALFTLCVKSANSLSGLPRLTHLFFHAPARRN